MLEKQEIILEGKTTIKIPSVSEWNITALRYTCKRNKVKGYTKMTKEELVKEVEDIFSKLGRNV